MAAPARPARPRTPVSIAILAVNVAVFVAQLALPGPSGEVDEVALRLALWAPSLWDGEVWRLLTAAFIHFGPLHIFFNMFVLWDIGRLCEVVVRPARYALLYAASAVGGTVASTLFTRGLSGGASGALFGVAGALLALVLLDRERRVFVQRDRLKGLLLRFLVINMALQFAIPHIDIAAHVGGCVTGAAVGAYLFGRSPLSGDRGAPIRRASLAALILILLVAAYSLHPVGHPRFEAWRISPARLIDILLGN
ncbi:MAG: rhomboid family intramembrane serine protease [Deltaproteobacteria bacterium]|nr:rhomboid family intramembrane serine protease [Deltaproteobacteria bacterium]